MVFMSPGHVKIRIVNISSNTYIHTYSTVIIYELITLKWVPQVVTWRELKFKRLGLKMAPNKIPDIPSWAEGPQRNLKDGLNPGGSTSLHGSV